MKNKHLSFEERVTIEECLDKKMTVSHIHPDDVILKPMLLQKY